MQKNILKLSCIPHTSLSYETIVYIFKLTTLEQLVQLLSKHCNKSPRLSANPAISTKLRGWKECNLESNPILCNLQPPKIKMRETNNVNVNWRKTYSKIVNVYFEQRFNNLVCLTGKLLKIWNQNLTHHSPRATTWPWHRSRQWSSKAGRRTGRRSTLRATRCSRSRTSRRGCWWATWTWSTTVATCSAAAPPPRTLRRAPPSGSHQPHDREIKYLTCFSFFQHGQRLQLQCCDIWKWTDRGVSDLSIVWK